MLRSRKITHLVACIATLLAMGVAVAQHGPSTGWEVNPQSQINAERSMVEAETRARMREGVKYQTPARVRMGMPYAKDRELAGRLDANPEASRRYLDALRRGWRSTFMDAAAYIATLAERPGPYATWQKATGNFGTTTTAQAIAIASVALRGDGTKNWSSDTEGAKRFIEGAKAIANAVNKVAPGASLDEASRVSLGPAPAPTAPAAPAKAADAPLVAKVVETTRETAAPLTATPAHKPDGYDNYRAAAEAAREDPRTYLNTPAAPTPGIDTGANSPAAIAIREKAAHANAPAAPAK